MVKNEVKAQRVESVAGLRLNEYLMYHGAPAQLIDRLNLQGLDPRCAGEHFGKLYGMGTYLATNASKSDIYTQPNDQGERCVLVVRTCLGEAQPAKEAMPKAVKPKERADGRGFCNSVVAVTQANGGAVEHPEYILYSAWQTLPQYAIWCAPPALSLPLPVLSLTPEQHETPPQVQTQIWARVLLHALCGRDLRCADRV